MPVLYDVLQEEDFVGLFKDNYPFQMPAYNNLDQLFVPIRMKKLTIKFFSQLFSSLKERNKLLGYGN
tara:strand:- start:1086 stop:1286 length:201 start_codon:yes stop_codon:yes gene_type:complete